MRGRTLLTYVVACFAGCTCESEHRELASVDTPQALLEADYSKELGCGAAGGHGFGIIFPTVERDYNQTLTITGGPLDGVYRAPERCACEGDEAELAVDIDGRRALVGCDANTWHVYYLVPPSDGLHCLVDRFDSRPDWADVPQFPAGIVEVMGGRFIPSFVEDVAALHGDTAAASVLAKMVDISGDDWVETVQALAPEARDVPLAALRDSLQRDEVPRAALDRAHALGEPDRQLIVSAIARYVKASDAPTPRHLRAYHYDAARRALGRLADGRVDDLHELTCTMLAADECQSACVDVFARTEHVCDGLAEYLSWRACVRGEICEGECTEESLQSILDDPKVLAPRRAAALAHLAALRRPELGEDLLRQWDRRRFEVDRSVVGCNPATEHCICAHDETLQKAACGEPLASTSITYGRCRITINDAARTLLPEAADEVADDAGNAESSD